MLSPVVAWRVLECGCVVSVCDSVLGSVVAGLGQ